MAEPAIPFPLPNDPLILVKELGVHVRMLSEHLQSALEEHHLIQQPAYLQDFAENVLLLHALTHAAIVPEMYTQLKEDIQESISILTHILNQPIDSKEGHSQMTLIDAVKNYTTPSFSESELSRFLTCLEKYPESFRVLVQELNLLVKDLDTPLSA